MGWGLVGGDGRNIYTGESDELWRLQTISLLYPVMKNSLPPKSFLDNNVSKFFPQANLSVQTRDREALPASQPGVVWQYIREPCQNSQEFVTETSLHFFHFLPLPPCWLRSENMFHLYVHMKAEATYSGVAAVTNNILVMGWNRFCFRNYEKKCSVQKWHVMKWWSTTSGSEVSHIGAVNEINRKLLY